MQGGVKKMAKILVNVLKNNSKQKMSLTKIVLIISYSLIVKNQRDSIEIEKFKNELETPKICTF